MLESGINVAPWINVEKSPEINKCTPMFIPDSRVEASAGLIGVNSKSGSCKVDDVTFHMQRLFFLVWSEVWSL